ncbi:hypothetical protein PZA11_007107 [Diplocarpon coronariae]
MEEAFEITLVVVSSASCSYDFEPLPLFVCAMKRQVIARLRFPEAIEKFV